MQSEKYILYDPSIEVTQPREAELIDKIVSSIKRTSQRSFIRYDHGIRQAHAKSHGILKGEMTVYPDLPEHLRQGLFAQARSYPVIVRLSTALGALRSDRVRAGRGIAIKIIGIEGKKALPDFDQSANHDILMANVPTYFANTAAYSKVQYLFELMPIFPDLILRIFGFGARSARKLLEAIGVDPPGRIKLFSDPGHNILGETFHSMAAIRFGDYIAKFSLVPFSSSVRQLAGKPIAPVDDALRQCVVQFFKNNSAEYELRAQLCTDLKPMPVEDASIEWPEELSPHQPIARITLPVQDAYSAKRRAYGDDILSFSSWRCLADHQPLGSIMRLRKIAYQTSTVFRHDQNGQPIEEPKHIAELPD
ncbi:MAG TPA: catalase family protein [Methylocella sp.]|nr:catalase family protein [Methylocella sp.]